MSIDDFYRNRQTRPQSQDTNAPTTTITQPQQTTRKGIDSFFAKPTTPPPTPPPVNTNKTAVKEAPKQKGRGFTGFISDVVVNKNPLKLLAGTKVAQQAISSGASTLDYVFNRFIPAALVIAGQEAVTPFYPKEVKQELAKEQRKQLVKNITPTIVKNQQGLSTVKPDESKQADIQFGRQTFEQTKNLPTPVRYGIQAGLGLGFEGIKAFLPVNKVTKVLDPLVKPRLVSVAERDLAIETGLLGKTAGKVSRAEAKPQYFAFENAPPNTLVKVAPVAGKGIRAELVEIRPSRLDQATGAVKKLFSKGGAIEGKATETVLHSELIPASDLRSGALVAPASGSAVTRQAAQATVAKQALPSMLSKYREIVNNPQLVEKANQLGEQISQAQDVLHSYEVQNAKPVVNEPIPGTNEPALKISTVQYADGKHSVSVTANAGAEGFSVPFSETYPSERAAIEAGVAKAQQFIRTQPEAANLQTLLNDVTDSLRGQEKIVNRGLQYSPRSKRVSEVFDTSGGQDVIATRGKTSFELGEFGRSHQNRKVGELKGDRFPESELADTLDHVTKTFRASNDRTKYRYDNVAWLAEMPNGEKRVVYTRINRNGNEEIINWHKVDETKNPNYLATLESFGSPDRIRTGISGLEDRSPNPLADRAKQSLPKQAEAVKPVELAKKPSPATIKSEAKVKLEMTLDERIKELEKICP